MRVTILGCGSSTGVPNIGCDCAVCLSSNPRNKRTRASIFIETVQANFLIDSSPDLREQVLRHNIRKVDAVLYTHDHADHANGIDDLRSFNYLSNQALPVYGDAHTMNSLTSRFPYIFKEKMGQAWYKPLLINNILADISIQDINISGVSIKVFEQIHGKITSLGYRFGKFAYSTDTNFLPEEAFEALAGVETWIVDCLHYKETYSHSHLEQTLRWIARVKPKLAILTHMNHHLDYDTLCAELPAGIVPAYDGMILDL